MMCWLLNGPTGQWVLTDCYDKTMSLSQQTQYLDLDSGAGRGMVVGVRGWQQADGMRAPHVRRATHVLQLAGGHYDHLPLDQVHQKHLVHHLRCVLSNMLVFIYSIEWDHWYEGSPWTPSPGSHWPTASCLSHTQGPLKQRIWSIFAKANLSVLHSPNRCCKLLYRLWL